MAGFFASAGVIAVTYICVLIYNKRMPPKSALITAGAFILIMGAAILIIPPANQRARSAFNRLLTAAQAPTHTRNDFIFERDTLNIKTYDGSQIASVTYAVGEDWVTVRDGQGNVVEPARIVETGNEIGDSYRYEIPGYRGNLTLQRYPEYFVYQDLIIGRIQNHIFPYMRNGRPVDIREPIPTFGFEGRERWGSMRGYIFSRSIPVMLEYPVIGSGPDSFINVFPQHDVIGKLRFYRNPYIIVDKAHNIYIQTSITTGGLSLLAILFMYGFYIITTFVSLVRSKDESKALFGLRLGLLAGVTAYCVAGLATDSTIGSTGVFYTILGLGYAVNAWIKNPDIIKESAATKSR
jgi:hypothetical protein